jgi:hypothetical protein
MQALRCGGFPTIVAQVDPKTAEYKVDTSVINFETEEG